MIKFIDIPIGIKKDDLLKKALLNKAKYIIFDFEPYNGFNNGFYIMPKNLTNEINWTKKNNNGYITRVRLTRSNLPELIKKKSFLNLQKEELQLKIIETYEKKMNEIKPFEGKWVEKNEKHKELSKHNEEIRKSLKNTTDDLKIAIKKIDTKLKRYGEISSTYKENNNFFQ